MKRKINLTVLILALLLVIASFASCGGDDGAETGAGTGTATDTESGTETENAGDEGEKTFIVSAKRVSATEVEVYYSDDYDGGDPRTMFFDAFDAAGNEIKFDLDYGYGGAVFFDNMLTLKLATPVEGDETITIVHKEVTYEAPYEAYYKYEYTTPVCGITVVGSAKLIRGMETLERAGEIVDTMLKNCPDVVAQMKASGLKLAIYGKGETAYHILEHRGDYDKEMRYVEGFGGITCSVTESNVWHWTASNPDSPDPDYYTAYLNESVLVHEFAHGVKIAGIDMMANPALAAEYQMVYRHAKAAGLWPESYAISNSDEFFATMSAIWFNVMNESGGNDNWDGVRGPINTRQELYNYDIDTYRFFAKLYPFTDLDGAWAPVPDTAILTGLPNEEAADLTGENIVFAYPGDAGFAGIDFTKSYKFKYADADFILDTAASSVGIGLWWDYSIDYPDNLACDYTFELVPGTSIEKVDYKTVYTVYIKGNRDGYLYAVDGAVYAAANAGSVTLPDSPTEFTLVVDSEGLTTISCEGGTFIVTAAPDNGAVVELTDGEGCGWYITDMTTTTSSILFIHGGEADGSANGAVAVTGAEITLTADAEKDGKTFAGWRVSAGTVADATATETTFTMPEGDAVVWAIYE